MKNPKTEKREKILSVARQLIHEKGYKRTTLADIANATQMQLGNLYYYYRAKDALAMEVIEGYGRTFEAQSSEWNRLNDPVERLEAFLSMVLDNKDLYARFGCPVGSLSQELCKDEPALTEKMNQVIEKKIEWFASQFKKLGCEDAHDRANSFFAQIQGLILLSNTFKDPGYLDHQIENFRIQLRNSLKGSHASESSCSGTEDS